MKRNRATELRREQRNLLAMHGFKWARCNVIDGEWYIVKHDWQWDGDSLIVNCRDSLEATQERINIWGRLHD